MAALGRRLDESCAGGRDQSSFERLYRPTIELENAFSPTLTKRCSLQPDEFRQGKPVNPRGLAPLNSRPVSARSLVWRFLTRSPGRRKVRAWLRPSYSFDLSTGRRSRDGR